MTAKTFTIKFKTVNPAKKWTNQHASKFQQRYESICRDRGWIDEDGHNQFPTDPEQRMEAIRDMFGLATISSTDATYQSYREQLDARELEASPYSDAMQLLLTSSDETKSAVLKRCIDWRKISDSSVYRFLIQIDRFDHLHVVDSATLVRNGIVG